MNWSFNSFASCLPAVHREGGSATRSGRLGEEHLQWDGGGTSPGSCWHGGGDVSTLHIFHTVILLSWSVLYVQHVFPVCPSGNIVFTSNEQRKNYPLIMNRGFFLYAVFYIHHRQWCGVTVCQPLDGSISFHSPACTSVQFSFKTQKAFIRTAGNKTTSTVCQMYKVVSISRIESFFFFFWLTVSFEYISEARKLSNI